MSVQSVPYTAQDVYRYIEHSWSQQRDWDEYNQALGSALCAPEPESLQSLPFLLLPGWCCQAAGGAPERAVGFAAAWVLFYTAAHILDDIEDGDLTRQQVSTINIATGLIFTSIRVLTSLRYLGIVSESLLQLIETCAATILQMCGSQHVDLSRFPASLEECWKLVGAKAGAWFALACRGGAQLGAAPEELVECYSQFGYHLGMLVQISDDYRGLSSSTGRRSDLAAAKRTLPVVYALTVARPETQAQLLQYLSSAPQNAVAETRARSLIEESGALLYLAVEAHCHYRQARMALDRANPLELPRTQLIGLLNQLAPFQQ